MIVCISSDAERDLADGFWYYERQEIGLGDYLRACLVSDIESLSYFGGIHEIVDGFHRALSKRFPFGIYYLVSGDTLTIVAVLDMRQDPSWIRSQLKRK